MDYLGGGFNKETVMLYYGGHEVYMDETIAKLGKLQW